MNLACHFKVIFVHSWKPKITIPCLYIQKCHQVAPLQWMALSSERMTVQKSRPNQITCNVMIYMKRGEESYWKRTDTSRVYATVGCIASRVLH